MATAQARHILVTTHEEGDRIKEEKEFDDVCFTGDVGVVHGPVKTQFGYHLIEITKRS